MSKKKNTLKDLDEFLKQQAATFVDPEKLGDKIEEAQSKKPVAESRVDSSKTSSINTPIEVSPSRILDDLKSLAQKNNVSFRKDFYDLIIKTLESQQQTSPEDMMLINTALYLKHGDNWKASIQEYWKNK